MEYILIMISVIILSPFVLKIALSQKKETKKQLRNILLFILFVQVILGFLNWKSFGTVGLGLFLIISVCQLLMLILNKYSKLIVSLNFINSVLIFVAMIKLSNQLGYQVTSFESIGSVFLVLFGNVVGLAFINKDKNLLAKYPFLK